MRSLLVSLIVLLLFLLTGCRAPQTAVPGGGGTSIRTPQTPTAISPVTTLPPVTATPAGEEERRGAQPASPLASESPEAWQTHTDATGRVTVSYPADWYAYQSEWSEQQIYFRPPTAGDPASWSPDQIAFSAGPAARATFQLREPNEPNEGGIRRYDWETPLSLPYAEGIFYVEGDFESQLGPSGSFLVARYYSEVHGLQVNIRRGFPPALVSRAEEEGLAAVVADQFPVFDQMMRTLTFAHAEQPASALDAENPWKTYTNRTGHVTWDVPTGWNVEPQPRPDDPQIESVFFVPAVATTTWFATTVRQVGPEDFARYEPHTDEPNEAGYKSFWVAPLSVPNGTGVMHVWGVYDSETPNRPVDGPRGLVATYFSEPHGLVVSITLGGDFPLSLSQQVDEQGLVVTVAETFPIYDHVIRSVQFAAP